VLVARFEQHHFVDRLRPREEQTRPVKCRLQFSEAKNQGGLAGPDEVESRERVANEEKYAEALSDRREIPQRVEE
jgi:hypothetical protein